MSDEHDELSRREAERHKRDAQHMRETGKTPEQMAEERRQELLKDFDRSLAATMDLVQAHPERYDPPYAGQKPREVPPPERVTSPERQDPEMPPREKPPQIENPEPPAKETEKQRLDREMKELLERLQVIEKELDTFHKQQEAAAREQAPPVVGKEAQQKFMDLKQQHLAQNIVPMTSQKEPQGKEMTPKDKSRTPEYNSEQWRQQDAARMAKEGVPESSRQAKILGLIGQAQPPHKAVEKAPKDAPEVTRKDKGTQGRGLERERD